MKRFFAAGLSSGEALRLARLFGGKLHVRLTKCVNTTAGAQIQPTFHHSRRGPDLLLEIVPRPHLESVSRAQYGHYSLFRGDVDVLPCGNFRGVVITGCAHPFILVKDLSRARLVARGQPTILKRVETPLVK